MAWRKRSGSSRVLKGVGWPQSILLAVCLVLAFDSQAVVRAEDKLPAGGGRTIQALIDAAQPGEVIRVPTVQVEGPIVIDKPVTLSADGEVVILSTGDDPLIHVAADGVTVEGFTLLDHRPDPDMVSLLVTGSRAVLRNLVIRTHGYGVQLVESHHSTLEHLQIEGLAVSDEGDLYPPERGNGIDLRKSNHNTITNNRVANMFDGIYVENGDGNLVAHNEVTDSRYGYHVMFSQNTTLRENVGYRNVTGAMIMSDRGSVTENNNFAKQSENATAQGILLFDTTGAVVSGNRIEGNRVGLFGQGVTDSRIVNNLFLGNFTGLEFYDADRNELTGNHFIANVAQAEVRIDGSNRVEANYWDDHAGLDLTGEGYSSLPYRTNSFFFRLTERMPPYQLFFQSPGMLLLEGLFASGDDGGLTDTRPRMEPDPGIVSGDAGTGLAAGRAVTTAVSGILMAFSLWIMFQGRRRQA